MRGRKYGISSRSSKPSTHRKLPSHAAVGGLMRHVRDQTDEETGAGLREGIGAGRETIDEGALRCSVVG